MASHRHHHSPLLTLSSSSSHHIVIIAFTSQLSFLDLSSSALPHHNSHCHHDHLLNLSTSFDLPFSQPIITFVLAL
jgi:hypothetical protein